MNSFSVELKLRLGMCCGWLCDRFDLAVAEVCSSRCWWHSIANWQSSAAAAVASLASNVMDSGTESGLFGIKRCLSPRPELQHDCLSDEVKMCCSLHRDGYSQHSCCTCVSTFLVSRNPGHCSRNAYMKAPTEQQLRRILLAKEVTSSASPVCTLHSVTCSCGPAGK